MAESNVIQPSFAAGELTPALYARVDVEGYHAGAATMRNFFVDYRGGASSRPGFQFVGQSTVAGKIRLYPFVFSETQTYILMFAEQSIFFIKNNLDSVYPNMANAGFILGGGGTPYGIASPYTQNDLANLSFSQSADVMYITHANYTRRKLSRIADTNWTLTQVVTAATIGPPASVSGGITGLPTGSTDPQDTSYLYAITAVNLAGEESPIGSMVSINNGIDIGATQGSVTLAWTSVAGASYYKVYKAVPTAGGVVPTFAAPMGFIGNAWGNQFTDGNIVPDFTQSPPRHKDPFSWGQIVGYNITNPGSGYPNYAGQIPVTDSTGNGAQLRPLTTQLAGDTSGIGGIVIFNSGDFYSAPTLGDPGGGSGFAATAVLNGVQGQTNPRCSAFFQQRLVFAGSLAQPTTLFGSRPGFFDNFDNSNPTVDSDSYQFTAVSQEVNAIKHMVSMPGGLVLFTDGGVSQLTGGASGANNPLAVTPSSAVIVAQSYFGCSDVRPIPIGYNILYPSSKGSAIRELQYNFFVNIYQGTDITVRSSHLFYPRTVVDWAYQDSPNKVVWCVRDDGMLLSLTYLKEQEVMGWARHDTGGDPVRAIASVREGAEDAVYIAVDRGYGPYFIERMAGRVYTGGVSDAVCLDSSLNNNLVPVSSITVGHLQGRTIYALADGQVLGPFVVPLGGVVPLGATYSKVVAGLAITAQLQTLYLDVGGGAQSIQGKRKKIAAMSVRVKDTAGLEMGTTFSTLTRFRPGLSSTDPTLPTSVNGLVTGDMRIQIDPMYSVVAQMCIQQTAPLPVTVLGVIPEVSVGDTDQRVQSR